MVSLSFLCKCNEVLQRSLARCVTGLTFALPPRQTASISTFTLADGKRMPWLAWGNGTGDAKKTVPKTLPIVLDAFGEGAHIDTAQVRLQSRRASLTHKDG